MAVIYPPNVSTDKDKLFAVYSLIEQMRIEHNKVGALASADPEKYIKTGKFETYRKQSKILLKEVLAEQNRLKENIRWANYTLREWKASTKSPEQEDALYLSLFGDNNVEKTKLTQASSSSLDKLKSLRLMRGESGIDPTEDLTTYTEVDPSPYYLTGTADRATFTNLPQTVDAYFYSDKGVNHFDGNYEHLLQAITHKSGGASNPYVSVWCLANIVNDYTYIRLNGDSNAISFRAVDGTSVSIQLRETVAGTPYSDTWDDGADNTLYYLTVERDELIGDYGSLYAYIYSDSNRTNLLATLSLSLHEKEDFRYIFTTQSFNTGATGTQTGYVELLDLSMAVFHPWAVII
jgi:hypothetical protein